MGKEENADNNHFLLFAQYFLLYPSQTGFVLLSTIKLSSANASNWKSVYILLLGSVEICNSFADDKIKVD